METPHNSYINLNLISLPKNGLSLNGGSLSLDKQTNYSINITAKSIVAFSYKT